MAIALGNHTKGRSSGSSVTGDTTISTAAGSTLCAFVTMDPGASVSGSVVDVAGNTLAQVGTTQTIVGGAAMKCALYAKQNAAASAVNNVTVNFTAAAFPSLFFFEITGAATASLDVVVQTAGGGSPVTIATGTLAQAAEMVVMCVASENSAATGDYTESGGATLTRIDQEPDGINYWTGAAFCKVVASTTTTSPSVAIAPSANIGGILASFKEAAAGSPATLSSPTPSGTLGTSTTATIGASTDQTSGTGYCVVDSAVNLSGVTASQIKAGQKASGSAALASGNTSVSASPFSISVSGLSVDTLYSYAVVQNNANGDSNVVTGTFTTAIPLFAQAIF